jgi:hypothetical protein
MKTKNILTLLIFLCFWNITQIKAASPNGSDCNSPLTAVEGINNSVFNGYWNQYFKYIAPFDGTITVSTVGLTDNYSNFDVYAQSCSGNYIGQIYGSNGISYSFNVFKGDSFLIETYMSSSNGIMPWSLSIVPKIFTVTSGKTCNNAVQVKDGSNSEIGYYNNYRKGQWFKYTPSKDGHIVISSAYNDEDYIQIYNQCGGSNLSSGWIWNYSPTDSNSFTYKVNDTTTYYLLVSSDNVYNNYDSSALWNFAFQSSSAANITAVNFYNDSSYQYVLNSSKIDTIAHTVTAYVSKNTNLNDYNNLIFYLSTGASNISKNGYSLYPYWYMDDDNMNHYYDGEYFNNSPYIYTVTSEDKSTSTDWAVSIVNSPNYSTGNNFTSFIVGNDTALIDTIEHTIKASINVSDITSVYTLFTTSQNASVSNSGSTFYSNSYIDYSDTLKLTVTSESGVSQNWKVIVTQTNGSGCNNPIIAKIGTNYGSGKNNYEQYFTYKSSVSGNIAFSTSTADFYMAIDTGKCGSLNQITSNWIYSSNSIILNADSGKTYTLFTEDLYADSFIISYPSSCDKPIIATLGINKGKGLSEQYFTYNATKSGNIIFSTSDADFIMTIDTGSCGSLYQIFSNWLYNGNSISLAADSGKTYKLYTKYLSTNSFTISYPSSCDKPIIAADGVNNGKGSTQQYFTYIATKNGNVTFSTTNADFYMEIDSGSCGSLNYIYGSWVYSTNSITIPVDSGKVYTLYAEYLNSNSFIISYPESSCDNPTTAINGINYGNGLNKQYFTYKAITSGFVTITSNNNFNTEIDSGRCGSLQYVTDGSAPVGFKTQAGSTYTLYTSSLCSNNFTITTSNYIQKEFTNFQIYNGSKWIYASIGKGIDTVNNTINIIVGPYDNLTNIYYGFSRLNEGLTTVIANNVALNSYGYFNFNTPVVLTIVGTDSLKVNYTVTINKRAASSGNDFLSYFLPTQTGNAIIDPGSHTIEVGISDTSTYIKPYFSLSYKAFATDSSGNTQTSGSNSFLNTQSIDTVYYNVIAEDSTVSKWKVIILKGDTIKSNLANISVFSLGIINEIDVIDNNSNTINITLPYGTNRSMLSAGYTISSGAKAFVNDSLQKSGITINNFNSPILYTVMAQDGSTKEWLVTVKTGRLSGTEILKYSMNGQRSSSIDTTSKLIHVYFLKGADITHLIANFTLSDSATAILSSIKQVSGTSQNDFSSPVIYTINAEDGIAKQNWTVTVNLVNKDSSADIISYSLPGQSYSNINNATHSINVVFPLGSKISNMAATFNLSPYATADINGIKQISSSTINDFSKPVKYKITSEDSTSTINWTINIAIINAAAAITSFQIPGQLSSSIDSTNRIISVSVPYGFDASNLASTFTISEGASAYIGNVQQVSGTTKNNFSAPVTYSIVAADGVTTNDWTVIVVAGKSNEASIIAYAISGQVSSDINTTNHTITVIMPGGSNIANLIALYNLSAGAYVSIGSNPQISGVSNNNFSNPVTYNVTAEDGTTIQDWTVTVSTITYINTINGFEFKIYPNPNTGAFNVLSSENINDARVIVTDMSGKSIIVKSINLHSGVPYLLKLNVPVGEYSLQIISGSNKTQQQIIIR